MKVVCKATNGAPMAAMISYFFMVYCEDATLLRGNTSVYNID